MAVMSSPTPKGLFSRSVAARAKRRSWIGHRPDEQNLVDRADVRIPAGKEGIVVGQGPAQHRERLRMRSGPDREDRDIVMLCQVCLLHRLVELTGSAAIATIRETLGKNCARDNAATGEQT
jgi:hypothetical protein